MGRDWMGWLWGMGQHGAGGPGVYLCISLAFGRLDWKAAHLQHRKGLFGILFHLPLWAGGIWIDNRIFRFMRISHFVSLFLIPYYRLSSPLKKPHLTQSYD